MNINPKDEEIIIIEDEDHDQIKSSSSIIMKDQEFINSWRILIVDDDPAIHQATKLILKHFTFEELPLSCLSAYSAEESINLIEKNPDLAVILLDVVMETNDAGLKVIHHVRNILNNQIVRIIVRTGHPGEAPEDWLMSDYEINDYKTKIELTQNKLMTSLISALRSYHQLKSELNNLEKLQQDLKKTQHLLSKIEEENQKEELRLANLFADET